MYVSNRELETGSIYPEIKKSFYVHGIGVRKKLMFEITLYTFQQFNYMVRK